VSTPAWRESLPVEVAVVVRVEQVVVVVGGRAWVWEADTDPSLVQVQTLVLVLWTLVTESGRYLLLARGI